MVLNGYICLTTILLFVAYCMILLLIVEKYKVFSYLFSTFMRIVGENTTEYGIKSTKPPSKVFNNHSNTQIYDIYNKRPESNNRQKNRPGGRQGYYNSLEDLLLLNVVLHVAFFGVAAFNCVETKAAPGLHTATVPEDF
jgi:hypothetical protein